jgi:hypothetical protein
MVRKYARLGPLYLESRGCTSLRGRSRRRRRSRGRHGWDGACRATTYQQADANSYHAHCVIKCLPGSPWSPALTCSRQILRNGPYFRVVGGRGHDCSRNLHQWHNCREKRVKRGRFPRILFDEHKDKAFLNSLPPPVMNRCQAGWHVIGRGQSIQFLYLTQALVSAPESRWSTRYANFAIDRVARQWAKNKARKARDWRFITLRGTDWFLFPRDRLG